MSAEEQRAREQFAKFDLDGDGLVSRDDFFAAMRRLDGARQKEDAVLQAGGLEARVEEHGEGWSAGQRQL